jgi:hypothetical protein
MEIAKAFLAKYFNLTQGLDFSASSFGGLIASHGRPAHFFYDTALGIQSLYENNLLSDVTIYQMQGSQFLKFEQLYEDIQSISSEELDFRKLNSLSSNKNKFFFKIGLFYGYGDKEKNNKIEAFDLKLTELSKKRPNLLTKKLQKIKSEGYFIIWYGITTDKRRWIEQEQAIITLAEMLENLGEKICLIVDGWTSPHNKTSSDDNQISKDLQIFDEINAKLPNKVLCLSIIGALPIEKVAIANLIDFHITNGGTGSIYPSRIAKKNGILHIANSSRRMTKEHIHNNSLFVPESFVTDMPCKESLREDYISYSIEPETFCKFYLEYTKKQQEHHLTITDFINCTAKKSRHYEFESLNNDPMVMIAINNKELLDKNTDYFFEAWIATNLKLNSLTPKLYIDYGEGFSETIVIIGKYNQNGVVRFSINDVKNINYLRFDPFENNAEFTLNSYNLIPAR